MDDRRRDLRRAATPRRSAIGSRRTCPIRGTCGVLLFATGAFLGCDRPRAVENPVPVVARIGVPEAGVSGAQIGLAPVAATLSEEGLTFRASDGRPRPRIAESWTSSTDGLTWRFKLKEGVTFHDGSPVDATQVVAALRTAIGNRTRLGLYPGLGDIRTIERVTSSEIEIRLRRRSSFLLEDLDYPILRVTDDKKVIATGAFRTVASSPSEIAMERHDTYHQGKPQIERVIIRAYPTLRTAWASLMRGEIDVLYDVSRDAVEFIGASDVALYSYLRHYVYVIAFNSANSTLASTPVRRALNAAVDRDALIKGVLKGQGVAASGPLWPHHWAYDSSLPGYAFDPSLAGATLDASGLKLKQRSDGHQTRFSFTCLIPENWVAWERIALEVQKQLYDLGVDMQLRLLTAEEYDKRLRAGDFDAVLIELWSGPTFTKPYAFWRWGGERTAFNVFGYRNPEADRWFDAVRAAPNDAEYRPAVGQLQRTLLEDPPGLFLAWSQRTRAVSRRFDARNEGSRDDPFSSFWSWRPAGKAAPSN